MQRESIGRLDSADTSAHKLVSAVAWAVDGKASSASVLITRFPNQSLTEQLLLADYTGYLPTGH